MATKGKRNTGKGRTGKGLAIEGEAGEQPLHDEPAGTTTDEAAAGTTAGAEAVQAEPTPQPVEDDATHHFRAGEVYARGIVRDEADGSIVVLPGSTLVATIPVSDREAVEKTLRTARRYRQHLLDDGVVEADGDRLVFTTRHRFSSRSLAAAVVGGRHLNGRAAWRRVGEGFGPKSRAGRMTREEAVAEVKGLVERFGITRHEVFPADS
jgi:hypothetical protein